MKKRYLYVLLFSVPALLAAVVIALFLFGAAAGVLWIFVYGDNPWPTSADKVLPVIFIVACAAVWAVFLSVAYIAGKRQEDHAALNQRHVMAAVGATALLVLFAVLHQWSVGNIGTPPEGAQCSRFCQDKGYSGSSMPPRNTGDATCTCLDGQGNAAINAPLGEVGAARSK